MVFKANHQVFRSLSLSSAYHLLTNQLALRRFAPAFQLSFARALPWTRLGERRSALLPQDPHLLTLPARAKGRRSPLPLGSPWPLPGGGNVQARRIPSPLPLCICRQPRHASHRIPQAGLRAGLTGPAHDPSG